MENEDKEAWCRLGEEYERLFLKKQSFDGVRFKLNPQKIDDKFTHDFLMGARCDLKTIRTAWKKADQLFGIPNQYAISINHKDIQRYHKLYPNIFLLLEIQTELYQGYHLTDLFRLKVYVKKGLAKRHFYQNRQDDNLGNARSSWVFNALWFPKIMSQNIRH